MTWRLTRGPWDGQTVKAYPGRILEIPVFGHGRVLAALYVPTGIQGDTITAEYEGYQELGLCPEP